MDIRKGSFTVEAAMLMGVVLFVVLSVLSVSKDVYNRSLMTAHAYETAVTGRNAEIAGVWGAADPIEVVWENVEPVFFIRTAQAEK